VASASIQAEPPPAPEPYLLDGRLDAAERLNVPVFINDQGPFAFVVDTGADRTVLADDIAERLGLVQGPNMLMHGITGAELIRTHRVADLTVGNVRLRAVNLPTLARNRLGVDGLLGVDALQDSNVIMDYRKRKLEIRQPRSRLTIKRGDEIVIQAEERFGRLAVVDTRVGNVRATAFIDSGGGVSIGNLALADALKARLRGRAEPTSLIRLIGTTGDTVVGEVRVVSSLQIGGLRFTTVPIVFCDLYVFGVWGVTTRPTVLVGADVLRLFSRVELDFGRGEVMFRLGSLAPVGLA
jgi:hypothetical protein